MERKKIDELWRSQGVLEAQLILSHYLDEDSEVLFTSSGEKYDSVPNHQAVTDMNADAKTLRIGTAWEYCHYCKLGVILVKRHVTNHPAPGHYSGKVESQYLYDHYFYSGDLNESAELRKLHFSPKSNAVFNSLLPQALNDFAKSVPSEYFDSLYKYISSKVAKRNGTDTDQK